MASTYIYRNHTAGNRRTWTWSAWIKRGALTGNQSLFTSRTDNSNYSTIRLEPDRFHIFDLVSSSFNYQVKTNRRLRDPNGWYHLLVAVDTTQATASNRIKMYVNGEQETSLAESSYPAQNYQTFVNQADTHNLGQGGNLGDKFDGSMSHVHFVDGTALTPSTFGSTDSTTGEWKINTSPTVSSYGTNGFFILKDGNSTTDQSGQSNNWTVSGTLTKTEDNPSNVFCTINPLFKHSISSAYSLNLVQGNTSWYPSSNSGHSWGRSTLGWTSGKYYMEFKIEEANTGQSSGVWMVPTELPNNISPQTPSNVTYGWQVQFSGSDQNFYTTNGGTTVSTITSSVGSNPIIMMAIDADNNKMWIGHNGTWWNNNNASTTLDNSYPDHTWTPGIYGDMYQLSFQAFYNSSNYNNNRANFGNGYFGTTAVSSAGTNASNLGIFEYNVPTGFTALCTKGLNE